MNIDILLSSTTRWEHGDCAFLHIYAYKSPYEYKQ